MATGGVRAGKCVASKVSAGTRVIEEVDLRGVEVELSCRLSRSMSK